MAAFSPATRRIILCADDFALAPGVSRAIVELLDAGRLSAVSCMTTSPWWPEHAGWLAGARDRADIGLHLTLNDLAPLSRMPQLAPNGRLPKYGSLLRRAYCRRLPRQEIVEELLRQLDAFESVFRSPPAFLDGHLHVHQLPVVRDAVIEVFRRRLAGTGTYLRNCSERLSILCQRRVSVARAWTINLPGIGLRRLAARHHIPTNQGFSGLYDFSGDVPYAQLFERFVVAARPGSIVVCHPGIVDAELRAQDSLTDQREVEYRYFLSPAFPAALAKAGVRLGRFHEPDPAAT